MTAVAPIDFTPREIPDAQAITNVARQYLANLQMRGRSKATVDGYRIDLEQFAGYAAARGITLIQYVQAGLVDTFIDNLLANGLARSTVARKQEALKQFFRFAVRRDILPAAANPASDLTPVRQDRDRIIAPPAPAIMKLIDSIPTDTVLGLRDRALLRVMYDGGMRVTPVIELDRFDDERPPQCCVWPNGMVTYRNKGGRIEQTVVSERTLADIDAWLQRRSRFKRRHSPDALFLSSRGDRLGRQSVYYLVRKYGVGVGLPDIHPHLLRHRRLGDLVDAGQTRLAQSMGAHKNINTTHDIYGYPTASEIAQRIRRDHPID